MLTRPNLRDIEFKLTSTNLTPRNKQTHEANKQEILRSLFARIGIFLITAVYIRLLIIGYRDYVSPAYDYFNFVWSGFSTQDFLVTLLLMTPMLLLLPLRAAT